MTKEEWKKKLDDLIEEAMLAQDETDKPKLDVIMLKMRALSLYDKCGAMDDLDTLYRERSGDIDELTEKYDID